MDGNIKPCKKCNSTYWELWLTGRNSFDQHYMACSECGYETEVCDTEEETIEAWNEPEGEVK